MAGLRRPDFLHLAQMPVRVIASYRNVVITRWLVGGTRSTTGLIIRCSTSREDGGVPQPDRNPTLPQAFPKVSLKKARQFSSQRPPNCRDRSLPPSRGVSLAPSPGERRKAPVLPSLSPSGKLCFYQVRRKALTNLNFWPPRVRPWRSSHLNRSARGPTNLSLPPREIKPKYVSHTGEYRGP